MRAAARLTRAARASIDLGRARPAVVVTTPPAPRSHFTPALYADLASDGVAWTEVAPLELPALAPTAAAAGIDLVVHLQWTSWALGTDPDAERFERAAHAIDSVGPHPLIWTIHNLFPHDATDTTMESELRSHIARRSSAIHVMNADTVAAAAPHYELPSERIVEIPHPDLWPFHGGRIDRESARAQLGLPETGPLISAIGQLRPYKGVEHLLDVAPALADGTTLLLAGDPIGEYGAEAVRRAETLPGVVAIARHLNDADVGAAVCASDVIVFPYRRMLNSGILDLAQRAGVRTVVGDAHLSERIHGALDSPPPPPTAPAPAAEAFRSLVRRLFAGA